MKRFSTLKVILLSTLAFSSFQAHAAPYVSGQVGVYGYGDNGAFDNLFGHGSDRRMAGRVAAGYEWDLNERVKAGVEGGLSAYQKSDSLINSADITLDTRRKSADLLGVINLAATPEFNVFAKGGVAYVKQKYPAKYQGVPFISLVEEKFTPKAAIGVGYNVTDNVNVNLSLNHEFDRTQNQFIPGASSLLVGVQYGFL